MYVITEEESYEFEYPIAIVSTINEAKSKAIQFLKNRSKMIDCFNIYEIREEVEKFPYPIVSLGRDGIFNYRKGNK